MGRFLQVLGPLRARPAAILSAMDNRKLLTAAQLAEIRAGVKEGIRGPVMLKWIELLLADHDERVRLEQRPKG